MGSTKTVAGVAQPPKNAGWIRVWIKKIFPAAGNKINFIKSLGYRTGIFLCILL
jgi:hypothetical protein